MLLGKLGGFEGSSLGEFLATQILGPEVKAVANGLPVQEEKISVRLGPVLLGQISYPSYVARRNAAYSFVGPGG